MVKILYRFLLLCSFVMIVKPLHSKQGPIFVFPHLTEFLKEKPNYKHRCKLGKCEVEIHKEQCMYRSTPRKARCLTLFDIVRNLMPRYEQIMNRTELKYFRFLSLSDMVVNACGKKIVCNTAPQGHFPIIPKVMNLSIVKTAISIPIRFGDFQMFGAGEWSLYEMDMKIKFTKENVDLYTIKGYSVIEFLPIRRVSEVFSIKIIPEGPTRELLKNMHFDTLMIQECKLYGTIEPFRGNYDLAFSGEPTAREFAGSRIRVFITKVGDRQNLAVLLELQDYSPVTLLKQIYGTKTISKLSVLRDRNQTIALYVSARPTTNFSNILMSHGSSRWLHRDSTFDSGAYLLVTIPFPKRKAVDMRIQLLPEGLSFSVPDSENLPADVVLGAISPAKIMHMGVDKSPSAKNVEHGRYRKIKILKFKYFINNDTYIAAARSALSVEDELEEIMPIGRPDLITEHNRNYYETSRSSLRGSSRRRYMSTHAPTTTHGQQGSKLDTFFKREDGERDEGDSKGDTTNKSNGNGDNRIVTGSTVSHVGDKVDKYEGDKRQHKQGEEGKEMDVLSIAEQAGIL